MSLYSLFPSSQFTVGPTTNQAMMSLLARSDETKLENLVSIFLLEMCCSITFLLRAENLSYIVSS